MDDKTMPTLVLPGEEEEKTPETAPAASAAAAVQAAPAPEAAPVAAQTIEPVDRKSVV